MLKGISDTLNVQQRSQTLSPAALTGRHETKQKPAVKASSIPLHRLESYVRWARVTQDQHRISASQVAEQGLKQVTILLKQLKKHTKAALTVKAESLAEHTQAAKILQQRLASLDLRYQGQPLIDHQLNLITPTRPASPRRFHFKSVALTSSKARDERISFQIGKAATSLNLPAHQTHHALARELNKGLKTFEIKVQISQSGNEVYSCDLTRWQTIQAGIMMTGQGQRLPAGEARTIKVDEILNWQDPREWQFNNHENLQQTLAKISKSQHKIKLQLNELTDSKQKIQAQLNKTNQQRHSASDLQLTIEQLSGLMQTTPFSLHVTSLMAQANVSRSQISSLLK